MKFIVSTNSLLRPLQLIDGVVSQNTVLPILEDFLFEIKAGKLTVSATDLETSMSTTLDVESKDNGKIAVPAKLLMQMLKGLNDQPLTFSVNEKDFGVIVMTNNGEYRLAGESGDDFPRIPEPEDMKDSKLPASVLVNAISKTLFAVGTDDMRPAMTGVYFDLGSSDLTFVSTDAHRLVRYIRKDSKTNKPASFIVPRKALTLLGAALPPDDTQVAISYNQSNAFFRFGNTNLICRLIDARFPDYQTVIPAEHPNKLTIQVSELLNTLRRIVNFANKTTYQVSFKIKGSELEITSRDIDFSNEGNEKLICAYSGEDMEIAFNGKFLIDMLSSIGTDEVNFEFSQPTRACLLIPSTQKDNEDLLMLVMPIMINN